MMHEEVIAEALAAWAQVSKKLVEAWERRLAKYPVELVSSVLDEFVETSKARPSFADVLEKVKLQAARDPGLLALLGEETEELLRLQAAQRARQVVRIRELREAGKTDANLKKCRKAAAGWVHVMLSRPGAAVGCHWCGIAISRGNVERFVDYCARRVAIEERPGEDAKTLFCDDCADAAIDELRIDYREAPAELEEPGIPDGF